MTRDSIVNAKTSQKMQRRVRFSRPEVSDAHSGSRGEFVRSESYREVAQGSSSREGGQRASSRRSQQSISQQTSNPGSYQVARDGGRKSQYNQLTDVVSSHPRVAYASRTRTPSSYFAGSKSGETPMPTVLPLPPSHWLGNVNGTPVKSCAQAALNEPSEGELRCMGMTLEIKTLLRMQ